MADCQWSMSGDLRRAGRAAGSSKPSLIDHRSSTSTIQGLIAAGQP
jgi:hypothetical protein